MNIKQEKAKLKRFIDAILKKEYTEFKADINHKIMDHAYSNAQDQVITILIETRRTK